MSNFVDTQVANIFVNKKIWSKVPTDKNTILCVLYQKVHLAKIYY